MRNVGQKLEVSHRRLIRKRGDEVPFGNFNVNAKDIIKMYLKEILFQQL
jgi:hypothetical protein